MPALPRLSSLPFFSWLVLSSPSVHLAPTPPRFPQAAPSAPLSREAAQMNDVAARRRMQEELDAAAAERRRKALAAEAAYRAAKGESESKFQAAVQSRGPASGGNGEADRRRLQQEFDAEASERRKKAAEAYAAFRAAKVVADAKFKATVEAESAKVRTAGESMSAGVPDEMKLPGQSCGSKTQHAILSDW